MCVLAVRDALTTLPTAQRQALILRYFADLSVHDTAAAMRSALAPGDRRTPAPACTTRAAVSFWSRPIGMHTSGTTAARPLSVVP